MVVSLDNMIIIDGEEYYKHYVFTKYAASKDGSICLLYTSDAADE